MTRVSASTRCSPSWSCMPKSSAPRRRSKPVPCSMKTKMGAWRCFHPVGSPRPKKSGLSWPCVPARPTCLRRRDCLCPVLCLMRPPVQRSPPPLTHSGAPLSATDSSGTLFEEPPFTPSQHAQPIHFLSTRACHAKVGGRYERMVDLAPLGEDDDEGARFITHPRHLEPRRGHRTPVHHLHPGVLRVERNAVVE